MENIKVVTGCAYGDESKGLVSGCLGKAAIDAGRSVLTVFYNGGMQRAHSYGDNVFHTVGASNLFGGATYYWPTFVVDPIALWVDRQIVYIDPFCRIVTPFDVLQNRKKERERGAARHGSCGMGIFETVHRARDFVNLYAIELNSPHKVYEKLCSIEEYYEMNDTDEIYNLHNFMLAIDWVVKNCHISPFYSVALKYNDIIFEGGQGLLLSQERINETKHLTPSSTGGYNICDVVNSFINVNKKIYYVSRTYMTRHGAGEFDTECKREDINPDIVDKVNMSNEWQGDLRFGWYDKDLIEKQIKNDLKFYTDATPNMVYTQLNYTDGKLAIGPGEKLEITKPDFVANVYGSETKDSMFKII